MNTADTILVGHTVNDETGKSILIVGRKNPGENMDIINAFEGDEARDLYERLVTKKDDKT